MPGKRRRSKLSTFSFCVYFKQILTTLKLLIMKTKKFLSIVLLMAMSLSLFVSCNKDDDDNYLTPNEQEQKSQWTINSSDDVIGTGQRVILTTNYQTNNPNMLITWYDGDKQLNSSPRSKTDYTWTAGEVGIHTIKAVITDREDVIEITNKFEVIETDLSDVILGDKKTKVLRTISSYKEKNGYIEYGTTNNLNKCYFNSSNDNEVVSKIRNEIKKNCLDPSYMNTSDYFLTLSSFRDAANKARTKYGNPITWVMPEAENVDDGVSEGIDFYNGRKTYKAVFKLRETHTVTLTLVGKVRSTYWSAGGQMVPAPESYTIITEVE